MADLETKLRISAVVDDALKGLRGLKARLEDVHAAAEPKGSKPAFQSVTTGAAALSGKLTELRRLATDFFAVVAGVQLGRNTLALIDAYAGLTARLKVTTSSQLLYNQALEAARALSSQYQAGLNETAKLIDRVYASISPLGGTLQNATVATEALLAALKVGGATAEETSSAILQFSQALGKGVLNGDELNSINEAAPGLLRALSAALGKTTADLKKMGEQGTLTSDVVIKAATVALPQLRAQAAAIGPSIGGGFTTLNNALLEFVGKEAQASGAAKAIAGALKLLAENIGLVVRGLELLAGAALVAGVVRIGQALTGFAAGVGLAGVAVRGLIGFLAGPVGLIVTLGSLAAAYLGVKAAQSAASDRTLDDVKAQRKTVQALVDTLQGKGTDGATAGRQAALDRNVKQLRELDAQITAMERSKPADAGGVDIRSESVLKKLLDENKGKLAIEREYQQERLQLESESAKKVAALRASGADKEATDLQAQTSQALVVLKKRRDDALKGLSKDETNTRIAQYVEEYDRIAELAADGSARELKAVQAGYDQALLSAKAYFTQRGTLEDEALRTTISKIDAEIAARKKVLEKNSTVRVSDVNQASALAEANKREQEAINKLEVERIQAQRELGDGARARAAEESKVTVELQRQQKETEIAVREANALLTTADLRVRLEAQYADARRREQAETGATKNTDELIASKLRIAELDRLRDAYSTLAETLALKESAIDLAVDQGAATVVDAERRKFEARAESLLQLEEILLQMRAIAATPGEQNAIEALLQGVTKLKDTRTEFERMARSSAISELTQGLTDIQTGAKSAGEALRDMAQGFAKTMLGVINKKLAEQLVKQFTDAVDVKTISGRERLDGIGSFFAGVGKYFAGLFHTGGVVGNPAPMSRQVDPAIFALAPRYHSGGIAGLRPNEVPAILQRGEEVLTADDPRHLRNASRSASGNTINISVSVTGANGGASDQEREGSKLASMLAPFVDAKIDQWAATQRRQGGILAGR